VFVALPKVVLAVPLVVLGAVVPGLTDHTPLPRRANVVGMAQESFDRQTITIRQGQHVEFVNNSNFLHVLAPGHKARVTNDPAAPSFGADNVRSMPRGEPFLTDAWRTPGSFQLTCTLHPEMNMTVVVEKA
jgi:plastocyanin